MAKKTRKVRKQAASQRAIQQAVNNVQSVSKVEKPAAPRPAASTSTVRSTKLAEMDPVEEFKYVRGDLRRIGILAASFTAILIALSFIIK